MSWWNNWYVSFLSWRVRHIKERNFIVILSLLVGIITGLAGVFLKNSVHYTHQFLTERLQIDSGSLLFFILPFIPQFRFAVIFLRQCAIILFIPKGKGDYDVKEI